MRAAFRTRAAAACAAGSHITHILSSHLVLWQNDLALVHVHLTKRRAHLLLQQSPREHCVQSPGVTPEFSGAPDSATKFT